jgi:hypothetical protein
MSKAKRRKKHADLDPLYMPRVRREFVDYDYTKNLSPEEKDFLAKFTSEYYGASIKKTKKGALRKGQVHTKKEHAKEAYDANNRRNNDVYGVTRINGLLSELDYQPDHIGLADFNKSEQAMIELLSQEEEQIRSLRSALIVVAQVLLHRERLEPKKRPSRKKRET